MRHFVEIDMQQFQGWMRQQELVKHLNKKKSFIGMNK